MDILNKYFTIEECLEGNDKTQLFKYSDDECNDFVEGFNPSYIKDMQDSVSKAIKVYNPEDISVINKLLNIINTLSSDDLKKVDNMVTDFVDSNPDMLWNMLCDKDKEYYKESNIFYDWLATLSDEELDKTVLRVADNLPIHEPGFYKPKALTKVEILDGYIAISSSNLDALDKFKERVLLTNDCSVEHRIKKHDGVTIHSYVFKMDNTKD